MLFAYAKAVIGYFYQGVFAICRIDTGDDGAGVFTIFDAIIHQIDQNLADLFFIGQDV